MVEIAHSTQLKLNNISQQNKTQKYNNDNDDYNSYMDGVFNGT